MLSLLNLLAFLIHYLFLSFFIYLLKIIIKRTQYNEDYLKLKFLNKFFVIEIKLFLKILIIFRN
jgi:hypothetical protein